MTKAMRKYASNYDINKGSVLLLFSDADAEIARSWRIAADSGDDIDEHDPIVSARAQA